MTLKKTKKKEEIGKNNLPAIETPEFEIDHPVYINPVRGGEQRSGVP